MCWKTMDMVIVQVELLQLEINKQDSSLSGLQILWTITICLYSFSVPTPVLWGATAFKHTVFRGNRIFESS